MFKLYVTQSLALAFLITINSFSLHATCSKCLAHSLSDERTKLQITSMHLIRLIRQETLYDQVQQLEDNQLIKGEFFIFKRSEKGFFNLVDWNEKYDSERAVRSKYPSAIFSESPFESGRHLAIVDGSDDDFADEWVMSMNLCDGFLVHLNEFAKPFVLDVYPRLYAKLDASPQTGDSGVVPAQDIYFGPAIQNYQMKHFEDALYLFKRSAKVYNNSFALYNIALMHQKGLGGDPNPTKALRYMKRAARNDLSEAQFILSLWYKNGSEGIPADPEKSFAWAYIGALSGYEKSADLLLHHHFVQTFTPERILASFRANHRD